MRVDVFARPRVPAMVVAPTLGLLLLFALQVAAVAQSSGYVQTNLVSDLPGVARFHDRDLVNAWGLSHSPTGPWEVSDNGSGLATQYQSDGSGVPPDVTIPLPGGVPGGSPTGNVFNNNTAGGFVVAEAGVSAPSQFIFATEDGTISGWNPMVDRNDAIIAVDRSTVSQLGAVGGAVYKGLALAENPTGSFLFATNFRFKTVEMFDSSFHLLKSFTDRALTSDCPLPGQCFAPFGIQNIGGNLFVSFALQNAAQHDDVGGPGNGFVDVFDTSGHMIRRFASQGTLNSPWGLAHAPADFGRFSNAILVGDFGDGRINAFNPTSGAFLGQLQDTSGHPITINGLWGLAFGNGGLAGSTNTLFFAAGIFDESHGLFGSIVSA